MTWFEELQKQGLVTEILPGCDAREGYQLDGKLVLAPGVTLKDLIDHAKNFFNATEETKLFLTSEEVWVNFTPLLQFDGNRQVLVTVGPRLRKQI